MSGIENVIGPEVWAALDEAHRHRLAKSALLRMIADPPRLVPSARLFGLGRRVFGRRLRAGHAVPWGWATLHYEWHRDELTVVPLWVAIPVTAWRRRWWPVGWLIELGLLDVEEAGYLHEARPWCPSWLWCFLNDADHDPRRRRCLGPLA